MLGYQLVQREVQERYRGTVLGIVWLLIQPLFMLLVYTFVFGEVLQLRFGEAVSTAGFALYLFTGLIVFNALSEVMVRSPLILSERRDMLLNTPLPAWLLPVLPVASSVLLEWVALLILLVALGVQGSLSLTGVLFYLPYFVVRVLFSLAAAFVLAPLGVFLRDLRQLIPALLTILLFISPILYPLSVIPEQFLPFYEWNLLGQLVQGYRDGLLEGRFDSGHFGALLVIALALLGLSLSVFHSLMPRTRYVL